MTGDEGELLPWQYIDDRDIRLYIRTYTLLRKLANLHLSVGLHFVAIGDVDYNIL